MYVCMVITYSKSKDQPGKVANPARGQLNRENCYFPCPHSCLRIYGLAGQVRPSRPTSAFSFSTRRLNLGLILYLGS